MTRYRIETRPIDSNDARAWTTDGIGPDRESNTFGTESEAAAALAFIRTTLADQDETWSDAEYRLVEVPE